MFHVPLLPRTLEAARRDLKHAEVRVRVEAARDLRLPGVDADEQARRVELLVETLRDPAPEVRRQALLALADQKAETALPAVLELLADAEPSVRQIAVVAVGELGRPGDSVSAGRVCCLLKAGDPALRYQALIAYARLAPEDAEDSLLEALDDRDPEVRMLSIRLLEESVLARAASLDDVGHLEEPIVRATRDPAPGVRLLAQLFGGELGFEVPTGEILAVVERKLRVQEPRDEQVAVELAGRLRLRAAEGGLRRRAFGALGVSLDPFRWQARAGLAALGDARAAALVERTLAKGSREDTTLLVFALGQVGLSCYREGLEALRAQPNRVDAEVLEEALARLPDGSHAADPAAR